MFATGSVAPSARRPPLLPPGEQPDNRWARYGAASLLVGRLLPMRRPPILVVSFPRSGSSWVGNMLAEAPRTAYLSEPLSHAKNALGPGDVVFEFEREDAPPAYRRAMAYLRAGVPAFAGNGYTVNAGPWRLRQRWGTRMVIKDVNPLAAGWIVDRLHPIVVLLVRHPAAVALSQEARGWDFDAFLEQFLPGRRAELVVPVLPAGYWAANAALQAASIATAMQQLDAARAAWRLVKYEDLCRDPVAGFRDLYDFTGLEWTPAVDTAVRSHAHDAGAGRDPFATYRDSAAMADAWRTRIEPGALADVRAGWTAHHGPFYDTDADW